MDNQFNQPGGGYPQQPYGGPAGYPGQQQPYGVQGDYSAQPPYGAPAGYTAQQQPYGMQGDYAPQQPYGMQGDYVPQQPYGAQGDYAGQQPYGMQGGNVPQQPYGGVQQPYADDGYQHYFDHSQSVMDGERPSGFPEQTLTEEKPRLQITPFHVAVVLVVLGFLGWFLYSRFAPQAAQYAYISSGSLSASHVGDCLIVRNEVPYDVDGMTSITYDAEEGSLVRRDDYICKVYSSGYNSREVEDLQGYRAEIREYQKNLIESQSIFDAKMTRVTNEVVTRVREVRDLISGSRGSLDNQEELLEKAVAERQEYLKTAYASDQRFTRLYDDELSQTQRIDSWTKQEVAKTEAIVSFYSDGYEYGLTASNYASFEPDEVRRMIGGGKPATTLSQKGRTTIYRMVRDGEWYVLFLARNTEWNPVKGQIYELQLERFENTNVLAVVESFTFAGGELLVRLRVTDSVQPVLYMRTCEAVLGENLSTLMVDERAIYTQDGMSGIVLGEGESFVPVNVLHYDGGNAYFQLIQQDMPVYEGMQVRLF